MRSLLRDLVDLCLPPGCPACGRIARDGSAHLCEDCRSRFHWLEGGLCTLCQARPAQLSAPGAVQKTRCRQCFARKGPLEVCTAGVWFEGETEAWVHRFKYPRHGLGELSALDPTARAVLEEFVRAGMNASGDDLSRYVIAPVPLHRRRLRTRGFNPAGLLASAVAKSAGARLTTSLLERTRDTPSQTQLDRKARRRNVRGAFLCKRTPPPAICLVDDVITTGATLSEVARTLRRAGARRVVAICAARTPQPGAR